MILTLLFGVFGLFSFGQTDSELHQLYQNAEAALHRCDYAAAKDSYLQLLEKEWNSDWATYIDIVTRLVRVELALGEYDEANALLVKLLKTSPPAETLPQIKLLQVRSLCGEGKTIPAYFMMQEIAQLQPFDLWSGEDRSLYHAIEYSLDTYYDGLHNKARRFFTAGSYKQAAGMFEELSVAIEDHTYPKAATRDSLIKKNVQYRLALSHYYQANFEKTLSIVDSAEQEQAINKEMLFLAAMAYREKDAYEKALEYFQSYINSADRADLAYYDHAILEIGLTSFRANNLTKARRNFEMIAKQSEKNHKPYQIANIFLAKIHIRENRPQLADKILSHLAQKVAKNDTLQCEISYLRGEAAFQTQEFGQAADYYESSLNPTCVAEEWKYEALYKLAWCYIKLADDQLKSTKARQGFCGRAETLLLKLKGTKVQEKALLALGRLYLISSSPEKCEATLDQQITTFSLNGQIQALLLCAEAAKEYETKESYYLAATEEIYLQTPLFAESWYLRGFNNFNHGEHEKAIFALEKASRFSTRERSAEIIKLEAKANFYLDAPLASFALLEKLLNQFTLSEKEREEILYLRGLMASRVGEPTFFSIAEESFIQVVTNYPEGDYSAEALHALASLYYQQEEHEKAKKRFLQLANSYPESYLAADAWFWAGAAADKLNEEGNSYRQTLVEKYPRSPRAAEAYFRLHPIEAYLEGKPSAMSHLQTFAERFPSSPLLVAVHYLFGTNEPEFSLAKEALGTAVKTFETNYDAEKIQDSTLVYFRYRSLYELALLHIAHEQDLVAATQMLQSIVDDFEKKNHPLTRLLIQGNPYPQLFEESQFALAQAYLKIDENTKAQDTLSAMLAHYARADVTTGYYLSHVWLEQANLAIKCKDFDTALNCLEIAEVCGKEFLAPDQSLHLWILTSECYRNKGQLYDAMRMLSQVINEDVVSSLRIKAMFLRAEIYELQDRGELALRQLESTAKKGGEWGERAKEKIRTKYGMD